MIRRNKIRTKPVIPELPIRVEITNKGLYYIVSSDGYIYHYKDNRWRKQALKEDLTYCYRSKQSADDLAARFSEKYKI